MSQMKVNTEMLWLVEKGWGDGMAGDGEGRGEMENGLVMLYQGRVDQQTGEQEGTHKHRRC